MPVYKLIYFNSKGAAEGIRLMFAYKGVAYEDIRIESDKWQSEKPKTPQGMLPVLEVDGQPFCQSGAIARYVAKELGMYGSDSMEALQIDEITDTLTDMTKGIPALFNEKDVEKKTAGAKEQIEKTMPKFVDFIIKQLKKSDKGLMAGNQLTLADIAVYRTFEILGDFFGSFYPSYKRFWESKELENHTKMVERQPKIDEWIKNRPQSMF